FGEFRIVRFFFWLKADVFQQGNIALLHVPNDLFRCGPDGVLTEDDRTMDEPMQVISDRTKRIFFDALSFWPTEMRHQNRLRAVFAQIVDGRQAFPNARIIGYPDFSSVLLDRHIEIDPHKHALAANIEVSESEFHVRRRNGVLEWWSGVTEFIHSSTPW